MVIITAAFANQFNQFSVSAYSIHRLEAHLLLGTEDGLVLLMKKAMDSATLAASSIALPSHSTSSDKHSASKSPFKLAWVGLGHRASILSLAWIDAKSSRWEYNRSQGSVLSGDARGELSLWDTRDGRCLLSNSRALDGAILSLQVDPTQKYVVCSGQSKNVAILSALTLNMVHMINIYDDWILTSTFFISDSAIKLLLWTQHLGIYATSWDTGSTSYLNIHPPSHYQVPLAFRSPCTTRAPKLVLNDSFGASLVLLITDSQVMIAETHHLYSHIQLTVHPDARWIGGHFISEHVFYLWSQSGDCQFWRITPQRQEGGACGPTLSACPISTIENAKKQGPTTHLILVPLPMTAEPSLWTGLFALENDAHGIYYQTWKIVLPAEATGGKLSLEQLQKSQPVDFDFHSLSPLSSKISLVAFTYPDYMILGTESGGLHSMLFHKLIKYEDAKHLSENMKSFMGHKARITSVLFPLHNLTNAFISGDANGLLILWDFVTCAKLASFHHHSASIVGLLQPPNHLSTGSRKGHEMAIAVSEDGTISFISLESLKCVAILAPRLMKPIAFHWQVQDDYLFLEREDKSIDVILHFQRIKSVPGSLAKPLIESFRISKYIDAPVESYSPLQTQNQSFYWVSLDIKKFISDEKHPNLSKSLCVSFLALLHTWGLDAASDTMLRSFGYQPNTHLYAALSGANHHMTIYRGYQEDSAWAPWNVSSYLSAYRLLVISTLLYELAPKLDVSRFIAFYGHELLGLLADLRRGQYQEPSLHYYAIKWADSCQNIASVAKKLFKNHFTLLKEDEKIDFVEYWKHYLIFESNDLTQEKLKGSSQLHYAALILGICGIVDPERLDSGTRRSIAEALFKMAQESSRSRLSLTAAEILSTGIQTWRQDMQMTLLLAHYLNMNLSKNAEVSQLARVSMLRIFESVGPACISLLLKEFLTSKHLALAQSTLTILSYSMHKRADLFSPYMAHLIEATMKILDPSTPDTRDKALSFCTLFLHDCVKTYAYLAYHLVSQRFAVAHEKGPIVVYDLRTGTKSHVLEGHYTKSTCLGFSKDAHHLASYSDTECRVLLWKLSASSLAMFLGSSLKPFRNFHVDPQFRTPDPNPNPCALSVQGEKDFNDIQFIWKSDDLVELVALKLGKMAKFSLHQTIDIHKV